MRSDSFSTKCLPAETPSVLRFVLVPIAIATRVNWFKGHEVRNWWQIFLSNGVPSLVLEKVSELLPNLEFEYLVAPIPLRPRRLSLEVSVLIDINTPLPSRLPSLLPSPPWR